MPARLKRRAGRQQRLQAGQQFVELAAGLLFLIPIVLVLIDVAVIVIAVCLNDNACRDAARIAASGRPTSDQISQRAQAALKTYKGSGFVIGPKFIDAKAINVSPDPANPPSGGGQYQGIVEVQTEVEVRLPAALPPLTPSSMKFGSAQRSPITYVEPESGESSPEP